MCGIAGLHRWDGPAPPDAFTGAMTSRLASRGPDGQGLHSEPGIALGHRRLAVIDLSERGKQPMPNEDGTVWLACNGEIYNYRELRRGLQDRHAFRSASDCEVLIHLYEELAEDLPSFLDKVRGMFAFCLWDRRRRRLVLGRDRLGIKPLVYYRGESFVAFASDLDALAACPEVPRRLDWTSLYEYLLFLTVPGPHTIYRDVRHVTPGSMLVVEEGAVSEVTYWRLDPDPADRILGEAEADDVLETAITEAVRLHLVADVPLGTFLSGGLDSGLVTALAAEACGGPLRTFAATFPGESVDEGPWAQEASRRLGTDHTEFALSSGLLEGLEEAVAAMDQPLALTSALSLFHLSRLARGHVKVVLTGDGGDEVFGGYNRHRSYPALTAAVAWIPQSLRPVVGRLGSALLPAALAQRSSFLRKARGLSAGLARDEALLYVPRLFYMQPSEALSLLPRDVVAEVCPDRYVQRVRALFRKCNRLDTLSRMLFVDLQTSLADEMLSKVDRMTMASGLEARVPLLDHRLVETAMRVGGSLKRDGSQGKLPLRRLVGKRLGQEAAWRPKSGFNSPLPDWLAADTATQSDLDRLWPAAERSNAFDASALHALKARMRDSSCATNLFAILVFGRWAEQRGLQAA